jgi:hypothetical protein
MPARSRHAPGVDRRSQYIELIWLVASLAMVGGALGAGLEADSTVREAAYSYRPDVEPPTAQPEAG